MDEKDKLAAQIERLEEEQAKTMAHKIDKIYEAIYGNGKEGLVTVVSKHGMILCGLIWGLGVIYSAAIGYITIVVIKMLAN